MGSDARPPADLMLVSKLPKSLPFERPAVRNDSSLPPRYDDEAAFPPGEKRTQLRVSSGAECG